MASGICSLRDLDAAKRCVANTQICDGFSAHLAGVMHFDIGAHQFQQIYDANARWIHSNMLKLQLRAGGNRGGDEEKRR
jgi:hypothetical protein